MAVAGDQRASSLHALVATQRGAACFTIVTDLAPATENSLRRVQPSAASLSVGEALHAEENVRENLNAQAVKAILPAQVNAASLIPFRYEAKFSDPLTSNRLSTAWVNESHWIRSRVSKCLF